MTRPVSGVVMADLIASGKATPSQLEQVKENHRKSFNIWQKEQQAKQEFGRGFQNEMEKERRVNAGLPEYDVQQSTTTTASNPVKGSKGRRKTHGKTAAQIQQEAEGSKKLGEMRKASAAKAKAAKAKHNAETNPAANPKKVHKQLKQAEKLSPGSTAGINEKELIETLEKNKAAASAPIKQAEKAAEAAAESASKVTGGTAEAVVESAAKASTGKAVAETAVKSGSKFTKYLKKAGKWGAIALAIGGLLYGGYKLLCGKKDDKAEQTTQTPNPAAPTKPEDKTNPAKPADQATPANPAPGAEDTGKTNPDDKTKVTPAPVNDSDHADKADKTDKSDKSDKTDKSDKVEDKTHKILPKDYTVKKGDNVWNIAKRRLQEMNGKKPTDREIANYTKKLLEENQLEYEADGYTVIIHSGDKIKYAA